MNTLKNTTQDSKNLPKAIGSVTGEVSNNKSVLESNYPLENTFEDNRQENLVQRKLKAIINNSARTTQLETFQKVTNDKSNKKGQDQVLSLANDDSKINTIQRYPSDMDDDTAKALGSLYSTDHSEKEDEDFTDDELSEIKDGAYTLTDLFPDGMSCNCIGWAQGSDSIENTGNIHTWESEDHLDYTPTAPDADDAKIILWGTKDGENENDENKWDIKHASVLLSHAEIVARSTGFGGFSAITAQALRAAGIDDPCWTSVGGFGLGAIVHPRNWHEGGDFGTALKGMK